MSWRASNMKTITQTELRNVFNYNENTGIFTWAKKTSKTVTVGKIAGTLSKGYIKIRYNGKRYEAHRLAWLYVYGEMPSDDIDHINRDRADNSIVNLRITTKAENNKNKGLDSRNTSGTTGVYWFTARNRWVARIGVDGKFIHLGIFAEYSEAVNARKNAEVLYGFSDTHGKAL